MDSVNYIENLLRNQLVEAIGKEVTAHGFETFLRHHYQKLFGAASAPKIFTYAVRRPQHFPDGILSIEGTAATRSDHNEPIQTFVRHIPGKSGSPINLPINAATSIEIKGDRYLHGWLQNRFDNNRMSGWSSFTLAARAHQFSNFMLVVGTMAGATKFVPTSAIILQNKDELLIPLITELIPSAKEFRNAIQSLSPEQQAFAKAFRSMQLESSLFGVCIIQLKPQLEELLGLPSDSLTKEIKLTQDLMNLFVDYQIPSDLLSVQHHNLISGNATEKLDRVKRNVKAVMQVIDEAKEEQLLEAQRRRNMTSVASDYPPPAKVRSAIPTAATSNSATPSNSPSGIGIPQQNPTHASYTSTSKVYVAPQKSRSEFSGGATFSEELLEEGNDDTVQENSESGTSSTSNTTEARGPARSLIQDFTLLPRLLDTVAATHDKDGSLRSTIVKTSHHWERTRKKNLLAPSQRERIPQATIETEKKKAFDLLDALSRSGSLPIEMSELHIVVAMSHCFEDDIMSTIIKNNINPIENVEKSALLIATTIHGQAIKELVGSTDTFERLAIAFPEIVEASGEIATQAA